MTDPIEVLKRGYWSKSEAFLLPLTGLSKNHMYPLRTYLFWNDFSIEDYYLILKFAWDDSNKFLEYCRKIVFPPLDREGYLVESHDFGNETLFILDMSEWALDIEMFLKGKYSKMSREAKHMIREFHTYYDRGSKLNIDISAVIEPNTRYSVLSNQTAIEYVAENYNLDLVELKKIGELGGIYNKEKETLILNQQKVTEDGV